MSFFKKLFGGGSSSEETAGSETGREDYKGFTIVAEPYKSDGQFQVAGTIKKSVDGTEKVHKYVRADRFASIDDATQIALMKGRQMVDQLGDGVFR
ncbi:MAG: hypothetical protein RL291_1065 [Pseudomonadota bacterium]|jgi:hypothetical protein